MKKAPLEKTNQDDNASIRGQSITAIGDSVLLGASKEVKKKLPDCMIDAKVSRQVIQSKDIVEDLKSKGKLGDTVVLALGTNGTFSDAVRQRADSCDWKGPEDLLGHSLRGAFAVAGRG